MFVYKLTNDGSRATAVVIAASRGEARKMRPDGAFWHGGGWVVPRGKSDPACAEVLQCWPHYAASVLTEKIGTALPGAGPRVVSFDAGGAS